MSTTDLHPAVIAAMNAANTFYNTRYRLPYQIPVEWDSGPEAGFLCGYLFREREVEQLRRRIAELEAKQKP